MRMKTIELQISAATAPIPRRARDVKVDRNGITCYDEEITRIVDYTYDYEITSPLAWTRATSALLDAIGAGLESIATSSELSQLVGPSFPSPDTIPNGFKLPGTNYQLDIAKGAFDMGAMIRYLNHNDAFLGAEWTHPSDNLGAILSTADVLSRVATSKDDQDSILTMRHVLIALIKAYEIQGCFQGKNAFNRAGLDDVILVKVASTAVVSWLMGLPKEQAKAAVSHAWVDGSPLRAYRQAPNVGPRKNWAAGDACMRAVQLTLMAKTGQAGVKTALSAPRSGFTMFSSEATHLISLDHLTESHGMTALEAALLICEELKEKEASASDIKSIQVRTQEAAMVIMNRQGALQTPSDRDHSLGYMIAITLLKNSLPEAEDYQNTSPWSKDPRVEELRDKITIKEDPEFTKDYHNQDLRSLANAIKVTLNDDTELEEVVIHFPQGHARRKESLELIEKKARKNFGLKLSEERIDTILEKTKSMEFFWYVCLRIYGFVCTKQGMRNFWRGFA
ncbi:2-methylcitrate dehydratase [Botrytis cinerea]